MLFFNWFPPSFEIENGRTKKRKRSRGTPADYQTLEKRNLLATFTVNTASDVVDLNDGLVSLREAITAANTNAAFGDAAAGDVDGDAIKFAASVTEIELVQGELVISDDLRIGGDFEVTLNAEANPDGVFVVRTSELFAISRLTIQNARSSSGSAINIENGNLLVSRSAFLSSGSRNGGAIYALESNVRIGNSRFEGNRARMGGAIFSSGGSVNLFRSTFTDGAASDGGAIAIDGGELYVTESTFARNLANINEGRGGAVYFSDKTATTIFRTSLIQDNRSLRSGGGLYFSDRTDAYVVQDTIIENNVTSLRSSIDGGGGILSLGDLRISNSIVRGNRANNGDGGGVFSKMGNVSISDSVLSDNKASERGGGIYWTGLSLKISGAEFLSNRVSSFDRISRRFDGRGGALFMESTAFGAAVLIENSSFENNFSSNLGGGIYTFGIDLKIANVDFRNNVVFKATQSTRSQYGGGALFTQVALFNAATHKLSVTDSSFVGNKVIVAQGVSTDEVLGGAIYSQMRTDIRNSEFASNTSDGNGGAIGHDSFTPIRLIDTKLGTAEGGNRAGSVDVATGTIRDGAKGGGLYAWSGPASGGFEIYGGQIINNVALASGGGIFTDSRNVSGPIVGGLVRTNTSGDRPLIADNRALSLDGGAIGARGVNLDIRDALFEGNSSRNGGGVFFLPDDNDQSRATLFLGRSELRDNVARQNGGAVNYTNAKFTDFANEFTNNAAINGDDIFDGQSA